MTRRSCILLILFFIVTLCLNVSCGKKKKLKGLDDPYDLLEKTVFTSKWKKFTINHPSGFWQVIKKEKWTLLYNNQDAPVQMIVDAQRAFFRTPNADKRIQSFLKVFKTNNPELISRDTRMIEGIEATRTVFTAQVRFDFWDKFYVSRKLEIIAFNKNKCSYLFAFIANDPNFEKYHENFELLLDNFKTLDKKKT